MDLPAADLAATVKLVLGDTATPGTWTVERVAYDSGSPATGGLMRVRGRSDDGRDWAVFVKLVQHARHWPRLHLIPAEIRDGFTAGFPWRQELSLWEPSFAGCMPAGLRPPALYRMTDLGDDRLLLWMEDIDAHGDTCWNLDLFTRAARALGGLAALRSTPELLAGTGHPPGWALRLYAQGRVLLGGVPQLADDDLWSRPMLAAAVDARLRDDLRRIAEALPAILDRLDTLPQTLAHGDASPQNLLVSRDEPGVLVAIDVAFQCPLAVGFDLSQLLVGLAHAGHVTTDQLSAIHERLVPAYVAGMREHGFDADPEQVAYGYVGALTVRSALTSLPYEMLEGPPTDELAELVRQRAALTRFLADLALDLIGR
jgi:Phosphotransferase enzyme family